MATKIRIIFELTCQCGKCSSDLKHFKAHVKDCREFKSLPPKLQGLFETLIHSAGEMAPK
ncbi:hypothetical protein NTE_03392 [Candidatus Nitrososphaera evergladensis SR1]|uniref:Uncharacterized protein n=1 Tax=Candidatus Nitrososphaera evergladensis SR1 TaxID=1459636 RepID=A0A075MVY9_9ARCH|nr:hypothetical protein [Candidatus Nitrososphaera evergladensis]AIF85420.1 hypothetical protein NTE_03392 [Candidatus Nitrososphaera evergladensis SR1]